MQLDPEDFDAFTARLDNPPPPNDRLKALMRRVPLWERVKDAASAIDKETAADLAIGGGIVAVAALIGLSMAGTGIAVQTACAPLVEPAPEVIRPVATDAWFAPPIALAQPVNEPPEAPVVQEKRIAPKETVDADEPTPRHRRRHHWRRG